MQAEIRGLGPSTEVRILGVNGIGHEAGNDAMCTGRTIPLLQDVTGVDAYGLWAVTYRDVVILDASNRLVTVFNLTAQDLGDPTHYAALRDLLLAAAQ